MNPKSQIPLVNSFIYATFPTAIGFLAGYLRGKKSAPVKIIDDRIRPLTDERLKEEIRNLESPKMVGISVLTITSRRAYHLARKIKKIDQEVTVILGGIHPTVLPEECLNKEGVDIVVRGEGEVTLGELYDLLKSYSKNRKRKKDWKKSLANIKGISYKKGEKIIHNANRELVPLVDIPPFPYDLFENDMDEYRDFGTIITSRGCPFNCIYCSQRSISGRVYRFLPNERVIEELKILIDKYHQKSIWFNEDNFAVSKKRLMSLCDAIIENGFHKKAGFIAELRGDSIDPEVIKKLKEANFTMLSFGAETTSERLMKVLNKGETPEANIRAVKMTQEAGMKASASFIFGIPTETREDRLKTMRDVMKLPFDNVRFNVAIPYPGTRLYEMAKEEGRLKRKGDWRNFNVQYYVFSDDIPYVPKGVNEDLLMYDTLKANLMFHFRWRGIRSLIKSPVAVGAVVTLPENWYLSPVTILKIVGLVFYLIRRFVILFMRASFIQLKSKLKSVMKKIKDIFF